MQTGSRLNESMRPDFAQLANYGLQQTPPSRSLGPGAAETWYVSQSKLLPQCVTLGAEVHDACGTSSPQ
jgi:hypothetical protein